MNIINKKCVSTIIGGISGNVTYNVYNTGDEGQQFEMMVPLLALGISL